MFRTMGAKRPSTCSAPQLSMTPAEVEVCLKASHYCSAVSTHKPAKCRVNDLPVAPPASQAAAEVQRGDKYHNRRRTEDSNTLSASCSRRRCREVLRSEAVLAVLVLMSVAAVLTHRPGAQFFPSSAALPSTVSSDNLHRSYPAASHHVSGHAFPLSILGNPIRGFAASMQRAATLVVGSLSMPSRTGAKPGPNIPAEKPTHDRVLALLLQLKASRMDGTTTLTEDSVGAENSSNANSSQSSSSLDASGHARSPVLTTDAHMQQPEQAPAAAALGAQPSSLLQEARVFSDLMLLFLSPLTAKTHVNRAMTKLGARDRAQLVVMAYQAGLVRP